MAPGNNHDGVEIQDRACTEIGLEELVQVALDSRGVASCRGNVVVGCDRFRRVDLAYGTPRRGNGLFRLLRVSFGNYVYFYY